MGPSLPVSVRFGDRPIGVIVDAPLALSEAGLLLTMALARRAQVWLPRGLYNLLDNDTHYRRRPAAMGGLWLPEEERDALLAGIAASLEPWRRAWQNGRLSCEVHWVGDARHESVLPERSETGLLPRFEHCCARLDRRGEHLGASGPIEECARDVLALAAALQPDPAYILTLGGRGPSPPPLLGFLAAHAIPGRTLTRPMTDGADFAFGPALAPLAASGTEAALVQIVAPAVLALGEGWDEGDWEEIDSPADEEDEADPWRGACALWRPMLWLEEAA